MYFSLLHSYEQNSKAYVIVILLGYNFTYLIYICQSTHRQLEKINVMNVF